MPVIVGGMSRGGSTERSLVPPAAVLALRPREVRLLAAASTVVWWLAGALAAVSTVLVVVAPIEGRGLATRLAFVGVGLFGVAASAGLVTARLTAAAAQRRAAAEAVAAAERRPAPDLPPEVLAEITAEAARVEVDRGLAPPAAPASGR